MIWRDGQCEVPGFGEYCVECVEWFSPPWSAFYFEAGAEFPIGKFCTEADARTACAEDCQRREAAFFAARMRGFPQVDEE